MRDVKNVVMEYRGSYLSFKGDVDSSTAAIVLHGTTLSKSDIVKCLLDRITHILDKRNTYRDEQVVFADHLLALFVNNSLNEIIYKGRRDCKDKTNTTVIKM